MELRPPGREDLDELLNALLPFAQQMLAKRGEFYPFGATMKSSGEVAMVAGYTGSEHPPSPDVIQVLRDGMRSQAAAGEIRAAGICYEVTLRPPDQPPIDAIAVALEHLAGDAATVYVPFKKRRFGGPEFGELQAVPADRAIFS